MEPVAASCPKSIAEKTGCCGRSICNRIFPQINFLLQVQNFCRENQIIFILDETITGFRWSVGGAQEVFGIEPDLTTFGKAMANGFSVAAVAGRRELMEIGSITQAGNERTFMLSTTHGAEMLGLSAFMETVKFIENNNVIPHLWTYGEHLICEFNSIAAEVGLLGNIYLSGPAPNPILNVVDDTGAPWFEMRTLFLSEMIKQGILMPWISICYRHGEKEMGKTILGLRFALQICMRAVGDGIESYYKGRIIKPVFRKFN